MPTPLKSKSAREFCGMCGWPISAADGRCEACGGDSAPLALADGGRRADLREPPGADDSARQAFDAWRARDWPRLIGLSLVAEGGQSPRTSNLADGPGWAFFIRSIPVSIVVQLQAATFTIEAPLVRLPQRQRVAAMRFALELCDRASLVARVCLRGDLLVVRFVARFGVVSPPMLRQAIRDVAGFAEREGRAMEASFDARPPMADEPRAASSASFDLVGRPRVLAALAPPASRSIPPPPPPLAPEEAAPVSGLESIPPILAPALAGGSSAPAAAPIPRPAPLPAVGTSGRRATVDGLQVEPALVRRPTMPPPASEGATPAERFCDLLRYAQALATAISYDDKPETMLLLVRSVVFRAIHEFGETVPDAVSHFYRSTQGAMKEIWQSSGSTAAARRRSSMQIPIAEPALLIMEQLVSQRAQVPREKRLAVDPLTTAAEAKAHVARYLGEIERAPDEPTLRHFLALGALSELLVRTKLPKATDQRLREIVLHAYRDGGKTASLGLMMKALTRIAAP